MFKYPYETTPASSYVLKDIVSSIQHAMVDGQLRPAQTLGRKTVEGVYEVPPYVKAIAPFSHPVFFNHFGKDVCVIDTRPFVRELTGGERKIQAATEFQFAMVRAILSKAWAEGDPTEFSSFGDIAARAFIRFLSEGIVRRLALSPMDQQALTAVTGFYWYSLFDPSIGESESSRLKVAGKIARITLVPADKVIQIIDQLEPIHDLQGYCDALRKVVDTTRLEKITPALIYAIVGGAWFGAAARETVAISLEYPPYFLAMVYMSLTDRSYNSAQFSKLIQQIDKNGLGKDFVQIMTSFMERATHV